MRLVGGKSAYEGRVEVCLSQRWGSVCGDGWSLADSQVVCRELGHPSSSRLSVMLSSNESDYKNMKLLFIL